MEDEQIRVVLARELDVYRERYESGDGMALLEALCWCAKYDFLIPEWADWALHKSVRRYKSAEAKDLGEAFYIERPPKFRQDSWRKRWQISDRVYFRIKELNEADPAANPIGEGLFERVGAEFNVSGSTARDCYYRSKRRFDGWKKRLSESLTKKPS